MFNINPPLILIVTFLYISVLMQQLWFWIDSIHPSLYKNKEVLKELHKSNALSANHENDTYFEIGLVIGIVDCIFCASLGKSNSYIILALCQTHCKQMPVFSRHFGNYLCAVCQYAIYMGCTLWLLVSGSLLQCSRKGRRPFEGADLGVPTLHYTPNLSRTMLA